MSKYYSSSMFCTNLLLHSIGFDPKSSLAGNMALTTGIPSSSKVSFFFYVYYTHKVFFKTLKIVWQNNVIFRRLALSSPYKASDKAH
jgi:hypothetical protein